MTSREKLIELLDKKQYQGNAVETSMNYIQNSELADYLLENGVIVLPCKVGDTVYFLARSLYTKNEKVKSGKVFRMAITEKGIDLFVNNHSAKLPYGKRSFLTKEEAEAKLKESEQNG